MNGVVDKELDIEGPADCFVLLLEITDFLVQELRGTESCLGMAL
jgi:hypothetical protein